MPLDLEEQEHLDNFKDFWKKYGKLLTGLLTAILLAYAGYSGWQWWKNNQAMEASKLYGTMLSAVGKGDKEQIFRAVDDLQNQFGRTSYAAMSGLVGAKVAADAGDTAKALSYLRWTSTKATDSAYAGVAKMRLVAQLIEQGGDAAITEADQLLKEKPVSGFEALWIERRGDWYLSQQKIAEARTNYQTAWKMMLQAKELPDESRRLLKVKLDAVGGV
ncbi:tetratricopeptide repeat protein [Polynucleobacter sp. IMCC 29146]|uniref:YfgM family protein n=1 Tax=Polynucleobacter sp. IMCC 29146 TaxID=2780953 RepID=UPI001F3987FB|nr:tetratricopeptide repeat protein [Polynucleobacter sp. IMCC 29146]MCE7528994.1 tetratricopeptide repeat protein [Polynucleobacter sp. IMCC 29146]